MALLSEEQAKSPWPEKLQDSKLLTEPTRERIFEPVANWVFDWAVGEASSVEIDQLGIVTALRLAGSRAFAQLDARHQLQSPQVHVAAILDGSHNWLEGQLAGVEVKTRVKADRDCVSVAAASVIAKVTRDRQLVELGEQLELRAYDLAGNKGYSSPRHLEALREGGPSEHHRKSWLGKILGTDYLF